MIEAELQDAFAEFQIVHGIKCFEWWCEKLALGDYFEGNNMVRREVFWWRTELAWKIFDHSVLCVCVYADLAAVGSIFILNINMHSI